jgi:hypothetical protein
MERRRRLSRPAMGAVPDASMRGFEVVIGLAGLIAAGKDVLAERAVARWGFRVLRTSDVIRAALRQKGVTDPSRQQLQDEGNLGRRESGDGGYWQRIMIRMAAEGGWSRLICNGIRNPSEVVALRDLLGDRFVLVGITAPLETRLQRALKRQQAGDPSETMEFLRRDDRDRGVGEPPDGQQVDRTLAMVDWPNLYNNAGTLEEYHAWIDALLARLTASR